MENQSNNTFINILYISLSWLGTAISWALDHADSITKMATFLTSITVSFLAMRYYYLSIKRLKKDEKSNRSNS